MLEFQCNAKNSDVLFSIEWLKEWVKCWKPNSLTNNNETKKFLVKFNISLILVCKPLNTLVSWAPNDSLNLTGHCLTSDKCVDWRLVYILDTILWWPDIFRHMHRINLDQFGIRNEVAKTQSSPYCSMAHSQFIHCQPSISEMKIKTTLVSDTRIHELVQSLIVSDISIRMSNRVRLKQSSVVLCPSMGSLDFENQLNLL